MLKEKGITELTVTIKFNPSRDQEAFLSKAYDIVFSPEKSLIKSTKIKCSQDSAIHQHYDKELL